MKQEKILFITAGLMLVVFVLHAGDQPQWGEKWSRNMISKETNLPDNFDPKTGKNIKWIVSLGTQTYATPIVSGGKVFIGTNNTRPRDPRRRGDCGVLLCLNEKDGSLAWQLVIPKIKDDPYKDWPKTGLVSPPTVEGDRIYVLSNRGEVLCLDIKGQKDGNDGPFTDEKTLMTPEGEKPPEITGMDADILWRFDTHKEVKSYPHDGAHCSILIQGRFLYVNTGNGVDNTHRFIRAPKAPSLIVLDKETGRLLAQDNEKIGPMIFHCTWSSPTFGEVNGKQLIFFGGGDGVCYAFDALTTLPPRGRVEYLKREWRFDCDPEGPKIDIQKYTGNSKVSPSDIKGMPVFHNGKVYVAAGGDIWWGKHKAWLKCIDAGKKGDITKTGEVWSYSLKDHCCSTPSIYNGLVFISDCGRYVHCLDAETGKPYWTENLKGDMWASTMVADGKVYIGTRRRDFWILAASKEKKILSSVRLDSSISGTATAANGVLYIATMRKLYAIAL